LGIEYKFMAPLGEAITRDVGPTLGEKGDTTQFDLDRRYRASLGIMTEVRGQVVARVKAVSPEGGEHSGHIVRYEYLPPDEMEVMSITELGKGGSRTVLPIVYRLREGADGILKGIAWFDGTFYQIRDDKVSLKAIGKRGERFELISGTTKDQKISLEDGDMVEMGKPFQIGSRNYVITRERIDGYSGKNGRENGLVAYESQIGLLEKYALSWQKLIKDTKVARLSRKKREEAKK
jgi:hypothetical protein